MSTIVSNWEDFISAFNADSDDIEFNPEIENKVIDMNNIAPFGVTAPPKTDSGFTHKIIGNGWTIKNLYLPANNKQDYFLLFNSDSDANGMEGLNFQNIYDEGWGSFISGGNHSKCKFSGVLSGPFMKNLGSFLGCSFNFKFLSSVGNVFGNIQDITYKYCKILIDNTNQNWSLSLASGSAFHSCIIEGQCSYKNLFQSSGKFYYCIFDLLTYYSYFPQCESVCIFNKDKDLRGVGEFGSFKPVAEAQLTNATYLQSIGFPVVDVNDSE